VQEDTVVSKRRRRERSLLSRSGNEIFFFQLQLFFESLCTDGNISQQVLLSGKSGQLNSTRLDSTAGVHAAYTRRSCRFKQRLRSPVRFIQVFAVLLCPSTCLRAFGSPFLLPLLPPLLLLKAVSNHQLFSGAFPPRRSSSSSSPSSSSSHPPPCKP
jgi:hypothetical protein